MCARQPNRRELPVRVLPDRGRGKKGIVISPEMVSPQFSDPFSHDTLGGTTDTEKRGSQLFAVFCSDFPRVLVKKLLGNVYMPQLQRNKRPVPDARLAK